MQDDYLIDRVVHKASYALSSDEEECIVRFLKKHQGFSIAQFPGWFEGGAKGICYHRFFERDKLVAVATVLETKKIWARIPFGPIVLEQCYWLAVIELLKNYYKGKGFWQLYIQPYALGGISEVDIHTQRYRDKNSWSTLQWDLTLPDLYGSVSKHHKRQIKKAQRMSIVCREISFTEMPSFIKGYQDMYDFKGLAVGDTPMLLDKQYALMHKYGLGDMFGLYYKGSLIGGVQMVLEPQGKVLYNLGYTLPQFRNIPIMHYAFLYLAQYYKDQGVKIMDLGGYNSFAKPNDQIWNINKFKLGFTNNIIDYDLPIVYNYAPIKNYILKQFINIRDLLSSGISKQK